MHGKIVTDWSKINFSNPMHRRIVGKALGMFMAVPLSQELHKTISAKIAEFGSSGDFPAAVMQIMERYNLTKSYDDGWRRMYDVRDFTGTSESGFDMMDVQSGLSFAKVKSGEKAKVYGMSGVKARVYFDTYGAGLEWSRQMISDRQFWLMEDSAIQFRNKAFFGMALNHYALIEAITSAQNINWHAPEPAALPATDAAYVASRDAETINDACATILEDCAEKGYDGVNAQNANFILSCPMRLHGRMIRAMSMAIQAFQGSPNRVAYNVTILPTTMYAGSSNYFIVLPGNKLKSGIRQNLEILTDTDILANADLAAGWMRYGAAVGDEEQVKRCAIA